MTNNYTKAHLQAAKVDMDYLRGIVAMFNAMNIKFQNTK